MIIGVFVGTLSSIFIVSPVAYHILKKKIASKAETQVAEA